MTDFSAAHGLAQFQTSRLMVWHWARMEGDAALRRRVEAFLPVLLTQAVLRDLPPSFALGMPAQWIAARRGESDVYVVEAEVFVGLLILSPTAPGLFHLGYLFAEPFWGKGYATELLEGLLVALGAAAPLTLLAGVATDNPASARVLRKIGFRPDVDDAGPDTEMYRLVLS